MEQLMAEVRAYANALGIKPSTVVQNAGCGNGTTWGKWQSGSSCAMRTAEKLRAYMVAHPATADADETKRGAA